MERRRQNLINSYARWANNRDRHRRRGQGFAGVNSFFPDGSSNPGTAAAAPGKRGTSSNGKRRVKMVRAPAVLSRQGRRKNTGNESEATAPVRWSREGGNDRALVLFSQGGSSGRLLSSRNLRRARLLTRGRGSYDHPASLAHGVTPFRELQFLRGSRLSSNGHGVIHAPSAETDAPHCPAKVTERSLAIVVYAPGAEMSAVTYVEPAIAMPSRTPQSTLGGAQISMLTAPPKAAAAVTASGRPGYSHNEMEQRTHGSSLVTIPSTRPGIGKVNNIFTVEESPDASGFLTETNKAVQGENNLRHLLEAPQKSMPPSARTWSGSGLPEKACRGVTCQVVADSTQSVEPEDRIVEIEVCRFLPKTSSQSRGASRCCQQTRCVGSGESMCLTVPDGGHSETVKERASQILPQHRIRDSKGEASDMVDDALIKANYSAVTADHFALRSTHPDEIATFLGNGVISGVRENHWTAQAVDIAPPVGGYSAVPRMETLGSLQAGFDRYKTNGGSGQLLLCDARVGVDDSNTAASEVCTQQGRKCRKLTLAPSGSQPASRPLTVKTTNACLDSVQVGSDTRNVPHGIFGSAVGTCTSNHSKEWRGEPRLTLAIEREGDGQRSEPSGYSGDSIAAAWCQQALSQVGARPTGMGLFAPSRYVGRVGVVSPNAILPFRALEPAKLLCLPESTHTSRGNNISPVQPVAEAESGSSSEIVAACIQDEASVIDQHEDNAFVGLGKLSIKHSARGNERKGGGGTLFVRDRYEDAGDTFLSVGQDLPKVSPKGTPSAKSDLPMFSDELEAQLEAPSPRVCGEDNGDFSTDYPLPCLFLESPLYPASPLGLATTGESVAHETKRDGGRKPTTVEPASAVPVGGMLWVESMAESVSADGSPTEQSPSSAGITPQPPSSSPSLRSPPTLSLKQHSPPLFAIADASIDLSSSVELFSTGASKCDAKSDEDGCVLPVPVVHWRRYKGEEQSRRVLDASKQERAGHERKERRGATPASK